MLKVLLSISIFLIAVFSYCYIYHKKRARKYFKWFKYEQMKTDVDILHRQGMKIEEIQKYINKKYKGVFERPWKTINRVNLELIKESLLYKPSFGLYKKLISLIFNNIKHREFVYDVNDILEANSNYKKMLKTTIKIYSKK